MVQGRHFAVAVRLVGLVGIPRVLYSSQTLIELRLAIGLIAGLWATTRFGVPRLVVVSRLGSEHGCPS